MRYLKSHFNQQLKHIQNSKHIRCNTDVCPLVVEGLRIPISLYAYRTQYIVQRGWGI